MGLIFRLFALLGLFFSLGLLALIAIVGYVLIAGGSSRPDCTTAPGNAFELATKSLSFDVKLASFLAARGRAPLESVSFDEVEAAARAARYFGERTDRISDVMVCFEGGEAEGFLRVDTVYGRQIGVQGKGTLDLSGRHPRVALSSARVAGIPLPGFVRRPLIDLINDQLTGVAVVAPLALRFEPDGAVMTIDR